ADLDVDFSQDPGLFEAHIHPARREKRAGTADDRGDGAAVSGCRAKRHRGRLGEDRVARDQPDQENGDKTEAGEPGARSGQPEASPHLWQWAWRWGLPHQIVPADSVWIIECPLRSR